MASCLGSYLIDNKICDESSLNSALEKQKGLKKNSIFKPIGAILAESGCVAAKDLDHALSIMHFERVSASTLSKGISRDAIKFFRKMKASTVRGIRQILFSLLSPGELRFF